MNQQFFIVLAALQIFLVHSSSSIKGLCPPSIRTNRGAEEETCSCINKSIPPWGLRAIHINCKNRNMTNENFEFEILPVFTESLDISSNMFQYIPQLESNTVMLLLARNNNIKALFENNFAKMKNLRELDLRNNVIKVVSVNAFGGVHFLQRLDLSRNKLHKLPINIFSPLFALQILDLSRNYNLNTTLLSDYGNIFLDLGVTPKLIILRLEYCGLTSLDISNGIVLEQLLLRGNGFKDLPLVPRGIEVIDVSENHIAVLNADSLPNLLHLQALFIEDSQHLIKVDDLAFFGLPNLRKLSFQNSRNLIEFSRKAFGVHFEVNETGMVLEELNLRGTGLKTLNSSISSAFSSIKVLNLGGTPLICDCEIKWIRDLPVETGGRCNLPGHLKGHKLTEISAKKFDCEKWAQWQRNLLNSLLILLLLFLCGACIFLIGLGLRPSYRGFHRKVGPSSPYARVTIEPNDAENHY